MNEITRICPWLNGFAHSKKPIFTPEECKIIINHGLNFWEEKTGMIEKSGHRQGYKADLNYRNVTLYTVSKEDLGWGAHCNPQVSGSWFLEKIYDNIQKFNSDEEFGFGFDIRGMFEPPSLMKYESPSGKYDWHIDIGSEEGMSTRKIAYSLHLNPGEYEGVELKWLMGNEPSTLDGATIGTMTLFPTYLLHRVTEVTSGIRYALVGWVHGDSFR